MLTLAGLFLWGNQSMLTCALSITPLYMAVSWLDQLLELCGRAADSAKAQLRQLWF